MARDRLHAVSSEAMIVEDILNGRRQIGKEGVGLVLVIRDV
jgi:hypothetical protein